MTPATDLITVAEAAKLCELSEPQIRARINDGRLTPIRIGPNIFLDAKTFDAFLSRTSTAQ
jgi:excisionase family DNA binding protein